MASISELVDYLDRDAITRLGEAVDYRFHRSSSRRKQVVQSYAQRYKNGGDPLAEALQRLELEEIQAALEGRLEHEFTSEIDDLDRWYVADLRGLSASEVREVAADVFGDAPVEAIEQGRWAKLFTLLDDDVSPAGYDSELEDDDWDDEAEPVEDDETPPWHEELVIRAGRGVPLPAGLEYQDRPLLAHQQRSLDKLRTWCRGTSRAGVLCLPTGAGKTRTAVAFALEVVGSGRRVLWLAHRNELVDQAIAAFAEAGGQERPFTIARFEAGRRKHKEQSDVVVASISTLAWQDGDELPNLELLLDIHEGFDLVIVDECHHAVARTWRSVVTKLGARRKVLGLSATPTRTSERERAALWRQLGEMIHEEPILELVKAGVLARPNVTVVSTGRTFEADDKERREYHHFKDLPVSLVKRISTDAKRNSLVIRTYLDGRARWKQTLIFAATLEQARSLQRQLRSEGVRCAELYASADRAERSAVVQAFRRREIEVLVNVMLFSEGTDLPAVDSVFVARPTVSDILFRQMVGRGMRGPLFGGTAECNVVAFHDNVHGLVDGMLGSTFGEQRAALEALGLGDAAPESSTTAMPTERSTVDQRERLALLMARFATLAPGRLPLETWAGIPLEGWWEIRSTSECRFLPVMADDRDVLTRFVGDVKECLGQATTPKVTGGSAWITAERLAEFADFGLRTRSEPRWVPIANATVDDARRVVAVLSGETREASVAVRRREWYGIARALDSARDAGDEVFEIEGDFVAARGADVSAISTLWDSMRGDLRSNASSDEIRLFARLACRALPPEVDRAVAERFLLAAARQASFPSRLDPTTLAPPLAEIAKELAVVSSEERRDRIATLHRSFFAARFPERESFLLALLESQFSKESG